MPDRCAYVFPPEAIRCVSTAAVGSDRCERHDGVPTPAVPPVPDGLADRLAGDVTATLREAVRAAYPDSVPLTTVARVAVDAVLAHPAVAAALAAAAAHDGEGAAYALGLHDGYASVSAGEVDATVEDALASVPGIDVLAAHAAVMAALRPVLTPPPDAVAAALASPPAAEGLRAWLREQMDNIRRHPLSDASEGALSAFITVEKFLAASPPAAPTGEPGNCCAGCPSCGCCLHHGGDTDCADCCPTAPAPSGETADDGMASFGDDDGPSANLPIAARPSGETGQPASMLRRADFDADDTDKDGSKVLCGRDRALSASGETAERAKALLAETFATARHRRCGDCGYGHPRSKCERRKDIQYDDREDAQVAVAALTSAGLLSSPAQTPEPDAVKALAAWLSENLTYERFKGSPDEEIAADILTFLAASPAQTDGEREWRLAVDYKGEQWGRYPCESYETVVALRDEWSAARDRGDLPAPEQTTVHIESRVIGPWSPESPPVSPETDGQPAP